MAAETCLIWSEPGGKIAWISAKRRGSAATEVDEHGRVHGGFPLPMGMEREDRCGCCDGS